MFEINSTHNAVAHLNARMSLGAYMPNRAFIRLSHRYSFWIDSSDDIVERFAIFVHEYAHYLHNFSTAAGIYDFVLQLRIAKVFVSTVDESGQSIGHAGLDDGQRKEYGALLRWRSHLRGSSRLPQAAELHARNPKVSLIESLSEVTSIPFERQNLDCETAFVSLVIKVIPLSQLGFNCS